MSLLPTNKFLVLKELIAISTKDELIWMNGYLSGILALDAQPQETTSATKPAVNKITIAYGTETGNSKKLAVDFASKAKKVGINAKVVSLDQYRLNDLPKEEYFLTLMSTHGEGEPPAAAKKFYDHIHANGLKLDKLKFSVLALGDTSYPLFATAGEDVDRQLDKMGGQRIVPLQKCDVDYDEDASKWFNEVIQKLSASSSPASTATSPVAAKKSSGKKVYTGTILTNVNLNDRGSNKETHHIEIEADGVDYLPGDSLGIVPENALFFVDGILSVAGVDANHTVNYKNETLTVFNLLKKKVNISFLPERVVKHYASIVQQEIPQTKIGLLDLLKIYPVKDKAQFEEVLQVLEPITPRLYSISSSPEAHSGEVHLTVARDTFCISEEVKYGLCSDLLCQLPEGSEIEFYIHKNTQFKLPAADKDIILIGPGTGIAPFRSFLAERDASGAGGRNWLFFGDQHFESDFLYQTEIQNWAETGVLSKVNVAFSRDQEKKVYVQHKMLKHGAEFFEWLEQGALIYVCGAKEPMSVDVENTILNIIERFGERSHEEAVEYLGTLKDEDRYLKDVY